MPLFRWLLALSETIKKHDTKNLNGNIPFVFESKNVCQRVYLKTTYCPLLVWSRRVTSVEAPGQVQLFAKRAYLNSSSQTTNSANFTCNLFSGLNIWTYCGTEGAKSLTAQDLKNNIKAVSMSSRCLLNYQLTVNINNRIFQINNRSTLYDNTKKLQYIIDIIIHLLP